MAIRWVPRLPAALAAIICALGMATTAFAADPVSAEFKRLGLKPTAGRSFTQPVRFKVQTIASSKSSVALMGRGERLALSMDDLAFDPGVPQPARVQAPLVFVGYGLHLPQTGHDDFAGRDLRGKILVMVDAAPASLSAEQTAAARALTWGAAERAGAAGIISLAVSDQAWTSAKAKAQAPGRYLAGTAGAPAARLAAVFNPAQAERLFADSDVSADAVLAAARAGRPLPALALGISLDARISVQTTKATASNIVGQITGSDPFLARNYVVVSAGPDAVPALLAAARAAAVAPRSKRSLIFAVLTDATLGARALAEGAPGPADSIVANLHIGASAAVFRQRGGAESSLGADASAVAAHLGLTLAQAAPSPQSLVGFAARGIPALELERVPGAERFIVALARRLADAAARPDWRPGSPFAPAPPRAQEAVIAPLEMPVGNRRQRLLPVYGA